MTDDESTTKGPRSHRLMIWYVIAAVIVFVTVLTIVLVTTNGDETDFVQDRDQITTNQTVPG